MINISIKEIETKKDLKAFIKFPMRMYKGVNSYVPPLISFELSTLVKKKNPAFENADAKYWVAKKDDEIVGRIAAIILNEELEKKKLGRFGWIDFIDDLEVSTLLLKTATDWAKSKGASKIHGPMGFTDLDFEGALIDGFEFMATQATIYNEPYYQKHYEYFGLEKAVDWVEQRGQVPSEVSKRLKRIGAICTSRFNLKAVKFKRNKDIKQYAPAVFELLNKSYSDLYGYYPLSKNQIDYYVRQYFEFIRKEFICIVVNEQNDVVGMAITLPSISEALKKAKGALFPFGFAHILRAFYKNEHLDLFLIGVAPEYQKLGAHAIIFDELLNNFIKQGVKTIATGPMLEDNAGVQNLWSEFEAKSIGKIRRRCYTKTI